MFFEPYLSFTSLFLSALLVMAVVFYVKSFSKKYNEDFLHKQNRQISEHFPLSHIVSDGKDDGLIVTKDGHYAIVFKVTGSDNQILEPGLARSLYLKRKMWLENVPPEVTVIVQSHRLKEYRNSTLLESLNAPEHVKKILHLWESSFQETFGNNHYIIFLADGQDIFSKMNGLASSDSKSALLRHLHEAALRANDRLGDHYNLVQIFGDELYSYFGMLLAGEPRYVKKNKFGFAETTLSGVTLSWPKGEDYQEYKKGNRDVRYSAWITIQSPPDVIDAETFSSLFDAVSFEFSLYQHFRRLPKDVALLKLGHMQKFMDHARLNPGPAIQEIQDLSSRIEEGTTSIYRHAFQIEVFADDLKQLDENVRILWRRLELDGITVRRECVNQEAAFWSKFPGTQHMNKRVQFPTTENIAHMNTFPTTVKGNRRCSFGDAPLATFPTLSGSLYDFIPHETEQAEALGNMLVVGKSGSGKTTFLQFLLLNALRFDAFRAVAFDRQNGMEVMTKFLGEAHFGSGEIAEIGINPLQLENSSDNRAFLNEWLRLLIGKIELTQEDSNVLNHALMQLYGEGYPQNERNISELKMLAEAQSDTFRGVFDQWERGGQYGQYFGSTEDSLTFVHNRLVTFEMQHLLDVQQLLGPLLYYVFHKISYESHGDPFMLVVDEAPRFFANDTFAPFGKRILDEIRKKNGVGVFAGQNLTDFVGKWFSESFKKQVATLIIFPDSDADRDVYQGEFGLNDAEFDFVRNHVPSPGHRFVLCKKKDAESVLLNVDLGSIGSYLEVLSSSASRLKLIRDIMKDYPNIEDYQREYLRAVS